METKTLPSNMAHPTTPDDEERRSSITMESVNRVSEIPVIKSTVQMAQDLYGKVKDYHPTVNSVLSTAESSVKHASEAVASTVASKFEGPIKNLDTMLCNSLDYVEEKVPAIKLPPAQMYENTKNAIVSSVEPAIDCVCAIKEYGIERVASIAGSMKQNGMCEKCKQNAEKSKEANKNK